MIFKNLIIFEMANNHMGDVSHGKNIIKKYASFIKYKKYKFAFKLQFRDLNTFIRPDYKNRSDLHYIKRFNETKLNKNQFGKLIKEIKKHKFKAIATPFDEKSVHLVNYFKLDYVKIASCSFNDWPLLETVAKKTNIPIILSTAGARIEDIDDVVSFLKNRNKKFCLLHCVGEYPTKNQNLHLDQIQFLKNRYNLDIGYSSHENPNDFNNIKIALSKGATIFEKHVGISNKKYSLNKYSMDHEQTSNWLKSYNETLKVIGKYNKEKIANTNEVKSLNALKRGVFLNRNVKKRENITSKDVFFAFPPENGQLLANDYSKYLKIISKTSLKKNQPLLKKNLLFHNDKNKILNIKNKIVEFMKNSKFDIPSKLDLEISHHYGIDKFSKFGLSMFTIINRKYCKKILILLPGQSHPTQYHKIKEETFNILHGKLNLKLNEKKIILKVGDLITIKPNDRHQFSTEKGCIIEELSSTHNKKDSYYMDKEIEKNNNRKTIISFWR